MKTNYLFLGLMMAAMPAASFAQKGITDGSKYGHGEDSLRCVQNLSMMSTYTKQKDFESAAKCWEIVYAECPKCSKNVYTNGMDILQDQYAKAKDASAKAQIFNRMMKLYDDRIKYFGKDKKNGKPFILGKKAMDYMTYAPENSKDPKVAYGWLNEVIETQGKNTSSTVFSYFFYVSDLIYKNEKDGFRDTYINDYIKIGPMLNEKIAESAGNEKDSSAYVAAKNDIDTRFAASGAADCKTLDGVYGSKIDANKDNKDFLNNVLKLYAFADCEESAVYFKASAYKHKIEPSASSARGLASQSMKNKDYNKALSYLNEAVNLESNNVEKSNLQLKIAGIYKELKNPSASRAAAQKAIALNKSNSNAYVLIGILYATFNSDISDDAIIKKTAFWAAVDQWEKAKQVNPSMASDANKLINTYKQYYPDKAQLFMRNITPGQKFTVPGWINETTTVRFE
ncbi:MAG: hypothetical protein MJZ14_06330 [Paludibacteraceae bacterium]|nr:hypothetical protein [Paludibacteraceae bacterium]